MIAKCKAVDNIEKKIFLDSKLLPVEVEFNSSVDSTVGNSVTDASGSADIPSKCITKT